MDITHKKSGKLFKKWKTDQQREKQYRYCQKKNQNKIEKIKFEKIK